jgi:hypothetical protein
MPLLVTDLLRELRPTAGNRRDRQPLSMKVENHHNVPKVLLGRHSDRTMERKGHVAVALLMAAIGIRFSGLISNAIIVMALLCFAQIGVSAVPSMFWPLPAVVPLRYDHTQECAGRIELLAHDDRGELMISAYVDHPTAVRCSAGAFPATLKGSRCMMPTSRRSL